MEIFWFALGLVVLLMLVLSWRHDQRMRTQGRSVRASSDMTSDSKDVRRDVRVAGDQAGWSRTAASYTSEQLAERAARRARNKDTDR